MPRPKNPPPDRRAEILEAALQVFARKGYVAATNAEIAREAGVTAAALYYYFPSKSDLFRAVMSQRQEQILPLVDQISADMLELDPEVVLPLLIHSSVAFMTHERTRPLAAILFQEGGRNPELREIWQTQVVGRVVPLVFTYLQHQVDRGRLKPFDPRALILTMNGPALALIMLRDLLQVPLVDSLRNEELAATVAESILNGLVIKPGS